MSEKLARKFWEKHQEVCLKHDPDFVGVNFDFLSPSMQTCLSEISDYYKIIPPGMELAPVGTKKVLKRASESLSYIRDYNEMDDDDVGDCQEDVASDILGEIDGLLSRYPQPETKEI